jgi:predicted amidohydrolase
MRNITLASVQFESSPGDKGANLAKIRTFVEAASICGIELIVFPECCVTGYWFLRHLGRDEFAALAERVFDGPSSRCLISMAREFQMTIRRRPHRGWRGRQVLKKLGRIGRIATSR